MADILLDYLQTNASGFIRGNRVGSLEQIIMNRYWNRRNNEEFQLLKTDVEKVSHVVDKEILELFGIEKE